MVSIFNFDWQVLRSFLLSHFPLFHRQNRRPLYLQPVSQPVAAATYISWTPLRHFKCTVSNTELTISQQPPPPPPRNWHQHPPSTPGLILYSSLIFTPTEVL